MARLRPRTRTVTDRRTGKEKKIVSGYAVVFYDPTRHPIRKTVTLRTDDEGAAALAKSELDKQYMAGLYDPWTDPVRNDAVTLEEAITGFLARKGIRENTITGLKNLLKRFSETLPPGILMAQIEARHIDRFLDQPAVSAETINTYCRRIAAFFRWSHKQGMIRTCPADEVEVAPAPKKLRAYLKDGQYESLVEAIRAYQPRWSRGMDEPAYAWFEELVRVDLATGLRVGELVNLRWGKVDLEKKVLHVRNVEDFLTKDGDERSVPLVGDALRILRRRFKSESPAPLDYVFKGNKGRRLKGVAASTRMRFFLDRAGLPKALHFHSLRHTFATNYVLSGGSIEKLSHILGHPNIATTMIYVHLAGEAGRSDMERAFGTGEDPDPDGAGMEVAAGPVLRLVVASATTTANNGEEAGEAHRAA